LTGFEKSPVENAPANLFFLWMNDDFAGTVTHRALFAFGVFSGTTTRRA